MRRLQMIKIDHSKTLVFPYLILKMDGYRRWSHRTVRQRVTSKFLGHNVENEEFEKSRMLQK